MNKGIIACLLLAWSAAALAEDVPAVLQWSQRVELSPRVSGLVREVEVQAGQRAGKGQPLVMLDSKRYQAQADEARAAVSKQREELAEAGRDLKRIQELYDRTVIATTELDQAKLRYARARAQVAGAQARLSREQKDLEDAVLRAPFDGVVVARLAEPGQSVVVGLQPQPLIVFAKAGEMVARSQLSESQIARLKPGQGVTVVVGKQSYSGMVKTLGLEPVAGKEQQAAYPVEVVFAVQESLRAGSGATLKLP